MNDISILTLVNGGFSIVDADSFTELNKISWHKKPSKHIASWVDGKYVYLHRLVNNTPEGIDTDHINRIPLDNRRCNLRDATVAQNRVHSGKQQDVCHSNFKGVTWHVRNKKWMATLVAGGKHRHLGYFTSESDAALAWNKAAVATFGEFAVPNVL